MPGVRTWRPPAENVVDPPTEGYQNYIGYQKIINSAPDGSVNNEELEKHIDEIMSSDTYKWREIPVDYTLLKPGERIRYITKIDGKNMFRTGGWITKIGEDFTWLAYLAHTHSTWCLQKEDCQRLFVTHCKRKKNKKNKKSNAQSSKATTDFSENERILRRIIEKRDKKIAKEKKKQNEQSSETIYFKRPGQENKFNSYLPYSDGVTVRVKSFRTEASKISFEESSSYQNALRTRNWEFI